MFINYNGFQFGGLETSAGHAVWQSFDRGPKRESFYWLIETIAHQGFQWKWNQMHQACKVKKFIQQALIQTLQCNLKREPNQMQSVFIVEKWAFFSFWILFGQNKGQHLDQLFNVPCIRHKVVLSYKSGYKLIPFFLQKPNSRN